MQNHLEGGKYNILNVLDITHILYILHILHIKCAMLKSSCELTT